MDRHRNMAPPARTFAGFADAADLRAAITATLVDAPLDEGALRRSIWTFVNTERHAGTSPGHVILALTELIAAGCIAPATARRALTRKAILWCVEAYFGHLGGDVFRNERGADTGCVGVVLADA